MPITARSRTCPERARPKAATAASNGMSKVDKGPAIMCSTPARGSPSGPPAGEPGMDAVVAVHHPDVADQPARRRDWLIVIVAPGRDLARRVHHDQLVKGEQDGGDADAREDQRREDLVRREARGLHRNHF